MTVERYHRRQGGDALEVAYPPAGRGARCEEGMTGWGHRWSGMHAPRKLIVDVDTGLDDAIALTYLFSSPTLQPLAVTCVAGNTDLDAVTHNTLGVLEALGAEVPVAAGAATALNGSQVRAPAVHGESGLGSMQLDPGRRALADESALDLTCRLIADSVEPVHLLALGPLTNVARFVTMCPDHAKRVASIFIMGGSAFAGGNQTATSEFNFFVDPEAADQVLRSGLPITVYGLDVFYEPALDKIRLEALLAAQAPAARLAGAFADELRTVFDADRGPLGDGGAAVAFDHSELLTVGPTQVAVECEGRHTRGAMVVDRRPSDMRAVVLDGSEVLVATGIDGEGIASRFTSMVSQGEVR